MSNIKANIGLDSGPNMKEEIILFEQPNIGEEDIFRQEELIQLFPYGLSLVTDVNRPTLLLKDDSKQLVLPVPLNPLEAGVALGQSNRQTAPTTPHTFSKALLESLDIEVARCVFVEIKGVHQFVRLYFKNHPKMESIKIRAEEAMSLCLFLSVPIFATRKFIDRSRVMSAEIQGLAKGLKDHPILNSLRKNQGFIQ